MPATKINLSQSSNEALFSLLQDRDESIASLAMEQILLSSDFEKQMQNYQDSPEGQVRKRVHQMGNIANRRRILEHFLASVEKNELDTWQGMMLIDRLYDPQSSFNYLKQMTNELIREFNPRRGVTAALAHFMKERNFLVPSQNWFDVSNFLLGDVLESRIGAAGLLCILAKHIGTFRNWQGNICLHAGRFCLFDENHSLIDPSEEWTIRKKTKTDQFHICKPKEILLLVLSQLFCLSVINWAPWDIHLFSRILVALQHLDVEQLPYPLGNYLNPERKYPEISLPF
ncbi:MAG: transglutaminase family protein [Lentisphaeria bacterium]